MEIPGNWAHSKRQRQSKTRNEAPKKKIRWQYEHEEPMSKEELCTVICQNVLNAKHEEVLDVINYDTILSSVPYKQILESLFGGSTSDAAPDIPVLTRKTEESFMRECVMHGERKCVMGDQCECMFIDRENPFVCVELLVGMQTISNCSQQMCVFCSRKYTQKLYYDMIFQAPLNPVGVIQRYGVMKSVESEYNPKYTLVMPPNGPLHLMPYPSPVHCRSNYTVVVRASVRYIVQKSDVIFQRPSLEIP